MEILTTSPELNPTKFTPPFRLGRKQSRAVLDANGWEVVVFRKGLEAMAIDYVSFLNFKYNTPCPNVLVLNKEWDTGE